MSSRKILYQWKKKSIQEMKPATFCSLTALYQDLAPMCQQIHMSFSWSKDLVLLDNRSANNGKPVCQTWIRAVT